MSYGDKDLRAAVRAISGADDVDEAEALAYDSECEAWVAWDNDEITQAQLDRARDTLTDAVVNRST